MGAVLARDFSAAVFQTYRVIVQREQARLLQTITEPVGARLAREPGDADCLTHRVIVHREQARLHQKYTEPVGARLAREIRRCGLPVPLWENMLPVGDQVDNFTEIRAAETINYCEISGYFAELARLAGP
ncbi:hypothetical protein IV01_19055 [Pseudomonas syringae]|uniref:Uncharacterized protein n=1 Tax=Pseudomonas syringae TaxID=317 RepID=A0A085VDE8_PSESX|nr:hypothetical protein IV01_19055 [Pseudomonas syringae]